MIWTTFMLALQQIRGICQFQIMHIKNPLGEKMIIISLNSVTIAGILLPHTWAEQAAITGQHLQSIITYCTYLEKLNLRIFPQLKEPCRKNMIIPRHQIAASRGCPET